ncbi:MerR family transcriptional regulator [Streptomyces sp. DT18]
MLPEGPDFKNPAIKLILLQDLGTIWEAARAAGVKPGTIRVWESRNKIERVHFGDTERQPLYHLPTVREAAQRKAGRPTLPDGVKAA